MPAWSHTDERDLGPMTVELIQGLLLAFALVVILMPPYIRLLQAVGFGKHIREEGPESHQAKEGTPTMGGLLVVAVVLAIFFFLRQPDAATFAPLAALASVGLLGAFDDYLNVRTGEGIRARQKLLWLSVVAFVAAYQIQQTYNITAIAVPFVGPVAIDPWVYVLFAAFAIVATANGVNLTDGLDGLSGGTVAIAFVAYMLIALLNVPNQANLALLCSLIIGALLGFLWFNVHPAQIFIGDSGALALGAALAVTALITGQILVLPLIGIIFVVETMSVIIQVSYFKLTGGKRLFRFTPLHHHFELGGWDEEKITVRFWIIGILAALLGVTLFLASLSRLG
jgi:phospho-N-acetylmuramoyl-pentapeptide-transferase